MEFQQFSDRAITAIACTPTATAAAATVTNCIFFQFMALLFFSSAFAAFSS
jgi:hypothetical protein